MDSCINRGEHEEFAKRMEAEHTRQNRRIALLEENVERFGRIACSVERLATTMEAMLKEQERQGERLDKLEDRPAQHWNMMVKAVLTAVGSAVGGGLLGAAAACFLK